MEEFPDRSDVPECVPARMLNEYAYCPRLAYIEWVQGDFVDNYETQEGRFHHRVVDREEGDLPQAADAEEFQARSVWLSAPGEHLTARIDLVQGSSDGAIVIDYKRGGVPDTPERSWESDRIHLCAQALVLRENGYLCDEGFLYYVASKTRVLVRFTDELTDRTRELVAEFRRVAVSGRIPPPLLDSPKCVGCSMAGICLPDETNLLSGSRQSTVSNEEAVRRFQPARNDAIPLYVQQQGAFITKRGELFEVRSNNAKIGEARIFETSQVSVFGNVQITTQALREMCTRGIPVLLFTTGGWFCGMAHGMPHKNVELRQIQYETAGKPERCLPVAQTMVAAKIRNCRTLLMRNHPELTQEVSTRMFRLAEEARSTESMESLLGVEGVAAKTYFSVFSGMIKGRRSSNTGEAWGFDFNGRNRRPPRDPVNAMLSYAYSLLTKDLTVTAMAVGFDPFMGFYHKPRYGRPALHLDLMEEFRPIVADSVVLSAMNNGILSPNDFVRRGLSTAMKPSGRKRFIEAYERRLDSLVTHPVFEYRISYRRVLEVQTRLLGRFLNGELPEYPGFRTR